MSNEEISSKIEAILKDRGIGEGEPVILAGYDDERGPYIVKEFRDADEYREWKQRELSS